MLAASFLPAKSQLGITRQLFPVEDASLSTPVSFHSQVPVSANRLCFTQLAHVRDKHGAVLPCALLPHMLAGQWLPAWAAQPCQWENLTFFYVMLAFWECILGMQACAAGSVLETAVSWWAMRSGLDAAAP